MFTCIRASRCSGRGGSPHGLGSRVLARLRATGRDVRGQVTAEYITAAAVMVFVGLTVSAMLNAPLRAFFRDLVFAVRYVAP